MKMSKINMKITLGDPGTGKSYDLVNEVLKKESNDESVYVFTPTGTATKRIINGYKEAYHDKLVSDQSLIWKAVQDTHVTQMNYSNEQNIFIDEFSMLTLDDFYSLLYKVLFMNEKTVNLYAYADEKQLEPVNGISCLMLLFQSNIDKFKGIDKLGFWNYVQNMLYDILDDMELNVPKNWQPVINRIDLVINHKNFRLDNNNGVAGYNEAFYQELLQNGTTTEPDYTKDLVDRLDKKYLIVVPTHSIGDEIDDILLRAHKDDYEKIAPFIRIGKDIWQNPNCEIDYGFDFAKKFKNKADGKTYKYSFYTTVHYCQGTTVDNSVFCMLNHKIPRDGRKDFYSKNMLYVAISRARHNSEYFGRRDVLLELMNTYPDNGGSTLTGVIGQDALNATYDVVIAMGDEFGHLSLEDFYKKYLKMFEESVKNHHERIMDFQTIKKDYKPKPFTFKKVISYMNPQNQNQFSTGIQSLGYDKDFKDYVNHARSIGGQIGGKRSQVKDWLDTLNEDDLKQLKQDVSNLSIRKFKAKWNHDRRAVENNLDI